MKVLTLIDYPNQTVMKAILSVLLITFFGQVIAQRAAEDVIKTSKGPLKIQPIKHASLVLTWQNTTIYVDPDGGAKAFEGLAAPTIILITDIHGDHFNTETLLALNISKAAFIVPQAVADKLPDHDKSIRLR